LSANPLNVVLGQLNAAMNRNVAQSGRATTIAQQLEGRALALEFAGTPVTLLFRVVDGRIAIGMRGDEDPADATLTGSPLSLLSMVGPNAEERFRGSSIRIAGDAEVAQRFRDLCSRRSRT